MYWKKCKIDFFEIEGKEIVKISGNDSRTNSPYWVYISRSMYNELNKGANFNSVLQSCDFDTKNFLATGESPKEKSLLEFKRVVKKKVYITNAVAHSIAYYAWVYINNHFDVEDKSWLSKKLSDIEKEFIEQSLEFLALYKEIIANIDIILPRFSKSELEKYFKEIDISLIKTKFLRKVYHTHLECEGMRSDYLDANVYHPNTGVFYENDILKGTHIYCLDEQYLKELGMRECKLCKKGM